MCYTSSMKHVAQGLRIGVTKNEMCDTSSKKTCLPRYNNWNNLKMKCLIHHQRNMLPRYEELPALSNLSWFDVLLSIDGSINRRMDGSVLFFIVFGGKVSDLYHQSETFLLYKCGVDKKLLLRCSRSLPINLAIESAHCDSQVNPCRDRLGL